MSEQPVFHGGDLYSASREFGIPVEDWLDLSTGINPDGYPLPSVPESCYRQLPNEYTEGLLEAAQTYYGAKHVVAAAGSQRLIQCIPAMREPCRVALPDVGYQEHAYHWQQQGHEVFFYSGFSIEQLDQWVADGKVDCVVVINPNNPTTLSVPFEYSSRWQQLLSLRGGWLIVDEAFADTEQKNSFSPFSHLPGVCVLRSIGKFFGLAGLRLGFALCDEFFAERLRLVLGAWAVNGPAQFIATAALSDRSWQYDMRKTLSQNSQWMAEQWGQHCTPLIEQQWKTSLFISNQFSEEQGNTLFYKMAQQGVLLRLWPLPNSDKVLLRSGLMGKDDTVAQKRFTLALSHAMEMIQAPC